MGDFIIVTGGDAGYFALIQELIASIVAVAPDHPPSIGVIDAGLTGQQAATLVAAGARVVTIPPLGGRTARALRARPALAVNLGKPWLDQLFADFETIVWLDADTWVQDWAAIEMLVGAAARGALAIVPGTGRYSHRTMAIQWICGGILGGLGQVRSFNYKNARNARLPGSICREIGTRTALNAGAYAMRADAPHWEVMRRWQVCVLRHGTVFTSDQMVLALAAFIDQLPIELLPRWCNYFGRWRVDPVVGKLVEFYYPYRPVGIVHMSGQNAMRRDATARIPIASTDGRTYQVNLRYGLFQRLLAEESDAINRAPNEGKTINAGETINA